MMVKMIDINKILEDCKEILPEKHKYDYKLFERTSHLLDALNSKYYCNKKFVYQSIYGSIKLKKRVYLPTKANGGVWKYYPKRRLGAIDLSDSYKHTSGTALYAISCNPIFISLEHLQDKSKEFVAFTYLHEVGHLYMQSVRESLYLNEDLADKFAFKYFRKLNYDIKQICNYCDHEYIKRKFHHEKCRKSNYVQPLHAFKRLG